MSPIILFESAPSLWFSEKLPQQLKPKEKLNNPSNG